MNQPQNPDKECMHRLQLQFNDEDYRNLHTLKMLIKVSSISAALRKAVRVALGIVEEIQNGGTLVVEKPDPENPGEKKRVEIKIIW